MANEKLTMKQLINAQTKKVLFAEAGKEVVEFLSRLLDMPLSTVAKCLKEEMVGCIGSLDQSFQRPNQTSSLRLLTPAPMPAPKRLYFRCEINNSRTSCYQYYTEVSGTACCGCSRQMTTEAKCIRYMPEKVEANPSGEVQGKVTYVILDDLSVSLMSGISCIALISKLNVRDLNVLEEKSVTLGIKEGLELLKASLESKTALTDIFLGKVELV